MYQVITYRSRKLKKNTIPLETEAGNASVIYSDDEEKLTRKEKKALKKELQRARRDKLNQIMGTENYTEADFNPEEIEDMEVASILNNDSFYDALDPIDLNEPKNKRTIDKKKVLIGIGIVAVMIILSIAWIVLGVRNL